MKRWAIVLVALSLLAVACGDSGVTSSTAAATSSPADTAASDPSSTPPDSTTTTAPPIRPDLAPCSEIWTLELIRSLAGDEWTFLNANPDESVCTYLAGSATISVYFRTGGQAEFDAARAGAGATAPTVDLDICDDGYALTIQDALTIVEGLGGNVIYNATLGGLAGAPIDLGSALVEAAC